MEALKAKVVNGRYVIEEKADLPEGTEVYLTEVDDDEADSRAIQEALDEMAATGEEPIPWEKVKAELAL